MNEYREWIESNPDGSLTSMQIAFPELNRMYSDGEYWLCDQNGESYPTAGRVPFDNPFQSNARGAWISMSKERILKVLDEASRVLCNEGHFDTAVDLNEVYAFIGEDKCTGIL